jgi:hypothetical protein
MLSGGNLYLAHSVAQVKPWRQTLAAAWLAVLAASGGLVLLDRCLPRGAQRSGGAWSWQVSVALVAARCRRSRADRCRMRAG